MKSSIISTTADSISSGGTVTGDLKIEGDLEVEGGGSLTVDAAASGNVSIIDTTSYSATEGGNLILGANNTSDGALDSGDRLGILSFVGAEDSSSTLTIGARIEAVADANWSASENGADMVFYTTDGNASHSEIMRLTADRKIGIGTAAPYGEVTIQGKTGGSAVMYLLNYDSDTSGENAALRFGNRGDDGETASITSNADGASDAANLNFGTQASTAGGIITNMVLDSSSRVSLSNNDNSNTGNTIFGASAFNCGSNNASDYNVVIGQTAMGTGTVSAASHNVAIGADAIADSTSAIGNVAIGSSSMLNATSAEGNVAIGRQSMGLGIVTGDYNIAIGETAGYDLVAGHSNTLLGYATGANFTANIGNVAIGSSALGLADNDEHYNIAIGYQAMNLVNSNGADDNIGIGRDALYTNGNYNIAMGKHAMKDATGPTVGAASNCIAMGQEALDGILTGDADGTIAIGASALGSLTEGARNTALGYQAGSNLLSQDDNTFIGYQAGLDADNPGIAPYRNTYIGSLSGSQLDDGVDNTAIGYNSMGGTAANGNSCQLNVAVGKDALKLVTAGDNNVVIGALAGDAMTSQSENTIIGSKAGGALTAPETTFVGYSAGTAVTTGIGNTAVGYKAILTNTIGNRNTTLGYGTMDDTDATTTDTTQAGAISSGTTITMDGANANIVVGMGVTAATGVIPAGTRVSVVASLSADPQVFVIDTAISSALAGGTLLTFSGALASDDNVFIGYQAGGGTWTYNESSDNIAIGSYALDAALDGSNGTIAIGSSALGALTSGLYNTAVGYNALKTTSANGDNNTAIGYKALEDMQAGGDATGNNTAVGFSACLNLTSGLDNTAFGSKAMGLGITTGDGNTAIGYTAGNDLVAGHSNTLLGHGTGTNFTANAGNVAVGYNTLASANDNENYNIAVGFEAMGSVNTNGADNNIAIGFRALLNSGGGHENIVIGYTACDSASMAADNVIAIGQATCRGAMTNAADGTVAIGKSALAALTSGAGNIAIGYQAGTSVATGSSNTMLGYQAGANANGSESNNTLIGYKVGYLIDGADAGNSNTLIGYEADVDTNTDSYHVKLGHYGGVKFFTARATLDNSYTGTPASGDAAHTNSLFTIPAYSHINRIYATVVTLSANASAEFTIEASTSLTVSSGSGTGGYELLGASPGTGCTVRSQATQDGNSDIVANVSGSGGVVGQTWVSYIDAATTDSAGWVDGSDVGIYICHSKANTASDGGADAVIQITVEYTGVS